MTITRVERSKVREIQHIIKMKEDICAQKKKIYVDFGRVTVPVLCR